MGNIKFVPLVAEGKAEVLSKPEKPFCEPCDGGNCDKCLYHPVNMEVTVREVALLAVPVVRRLL